jgi:hypothetical protein
MASRPLSANGDRRPTSLSQSDNAPEIARFKVFIFALK